MFLAWEPTYCSWIWSKAEIVLLFAFYFFKCGRFLCVPLRNRTYSDLLMMIFPLRSKTWSVKWGIWARSLIFSLVHAVSLLQEDHLFLPFPDVSDTPTETNTIIQLSRSYRMLVQDVSQSLLTLYQSFAPTSAHPGCWSSFLILSIYFGTSWILLFGSVTLKWMKFGSKKYDICCTDCLQWYSGLIVLRGLQEIFIPSLQMLTTFCSFRLLVAWVCVICVMRGRVSGMSRS